jgi:hypothetical protein
LEYVRLVEDIQLLTDKESRRHGWLEMGPHVLPDAGRNRFRFDDLSQSQSGSEGAKGRDGSRGQNTEQIPAQRFDVEVAALASTSSSSLSVISSSSKSESNVFMV